MLAWAAAAALLAELLQRTIPVNDAADDGRGAIAAAGFRRTGDAADPACHDAPKSTARVTLADQEVADAAYDRVRHLIQTLHLTGYSSGYVVLKARQAHMLLGGPGAGGAPSSATRARPRNRRLRERAVYLGAAHVEPASTSSDTPTEASDPSGYIISSIDECADRTGIRVHVADPAHGDTLPQVIPLSLIAKIKAISSEMPALVVGGSITHAL